MRHLAIALSLSLFLVACEKKKAAEDEIPKPEVSVPAAKDNRQTNAIGMELVLIRAGSFQMGSGDKEEGREVSESPLHPVKITRDFLMGMYPVTQEQYQALMGINPSQFKGEKLPVENVTWEEANAFCQKLSEKEGKTYRLPTEAEWEYACRAGKQTPYYWGTQFNKYSLDYCWTEQNSEKQTHPVGEKKPNAWGLYDMSGNVWQWCADKYQDKYGPVKEEEEIDVDALKTEVEKTAEAKTVAEKTEAAKKEDKKSETKTEMDPVGPEKGTDRVARGGSWFSHPRFCRSAYRNHFTSNYKNAFLGFRVVLVPPVAAP